MDDDVPSAEVTTGESASSWEDAFSGIDAHATFAGEVLLRLGRQLTMMLGRQYLQ
jgi:hypothetical protein